MKRLSLELSDELMEKMNVAIIKCDISKATYIRAAIDLINLVAIQGYEIVLVKNGKEKSVYIPGISIGGKDENI